MFILWSKQPLYGKMLEETIFVGEAIQEGGKKQRSFSKEE
jgi:hypothetical protein